jgi:hypothetical protein
VNSRLPSFDSSTNASVVRVGGGSRRTRGRFAAHGVQGAQDEVPEEVIAQASDEACLRSEFRYGDRDVRRCAARAGGELELYFGRRLLLVNVRHHLTRRHNLAHRSATPCCCWLRVERWR